MKRTGPQSELLVGVHHVKKCNEVCIDVAKSKSTDGIRKRTYTNTVYSDDDFVDGNKKNDATKLMKVNRPTKKSKKAKVSNEKTKIKRTMKKGTLSTRQSPLQLVKVMSILSTEQKQWLTEMGFQSLLTFKIEKVPARLAYWVVDSFDPVKCVFKVGTREFRITRQSVEEILGFPTGQAKIPCLTREGVGGRSILRKWRGQFGKSAGIRKRIYVKNVIELIGSSKEVGDFFKLNILVVIMTVLAEGIKCSTANQNILPYIKNENDIKGIDWCDYVLECLKKSKDDWDRDDPQSWYTGPLLFLVVWYVHNTRGELSSQNVVIPAILNWTTDALKQRESEELAAGGFGQKDFTIEDSNNMKIMKTEDARPIKEGGDDETESLIHAGEKMDAETDESEALEGYNPYDTQELIEQLWTPRSTNGIIENDEEWQEYDYTEEEYEYELKSILKYLCKSKVELEEKMGKALNKFPKSELICSTISWLRSELAKLFKIVNLNEANDVGNASNAKEVTYVTNENQTPTLTQILSDPIVCEILENSALDAVVRRKQSGSGVFFKSKENDGNTSNLGNIKQSASLGLGVSLTKQSFKGKLSLKCASNVYGAGKVGGDACFRNHQPQNHDAMMHTPSGGIPLARSLEKEMAEVAFKPQDEAPQARVRRRLKPAAAMKSPYYDRVVKMRTSLKSIEYQVTDCFFQALAPEYDIVFQHPSGTEMARVMVESLMPESEVHVGVIDAWACILNHEQQFKSDGAPNRLFFNTTIMSHAMMGGTMPYERRYANFKENVDNVIRNTRVQMCDAELVFIPIIRRSHFYLICFNFKTESTYLIDNMAAGDDSLDRYNGIPNLVKKLFVDYLDTTYKAKAKKISLSDILRLRMGWRTTNNWVDCGVFMMRHMETFSGNGLTGWDAGFSKEGETQKDQLDRLRHKYLAKILLWDANAMKWKVDSEIEAYNSLTRDEKIQLGENAQERIEERLRRFA